MNWLDFFASVIGSLAWPAVLVGLLYFLRQPIKDLLPLVGRLKYKEFELEFQRRVDEVSADVGEELQMATPNAEPSNADLNKYAALADTSPRAAVLEAWLSVEAAALGTARRLGWQAPSSKASNGSFAMKFLERHPALDRGIVGLLRELRSLRNQAAHAPDFALSKGAAIEYGLSASRVATYLKTVAAPDE